MSERNGLPRSDWNMPPGVRAAEADGDYGNEYGLDCGCDWTEGVLEQCQMHKAAPEMLAALKGLFEHCAMVHKHWGEGSNQREADAAIEAAKAAMAKAEGRQP